MDLLSSYTDFLQEKDEEKKSKWKDRLKKYGKAAFGVAAAAGATYAGYKGIQHLRKKGAVDPKVAQKKKLMQKPHATASVNPKEKNLKPGESHTRKDGSTVTKMTPEMIAASKKRREIKRQRRQKMLQKANIARQKCGSGNTAVFKMGKFSHCK